MFEMILMTQLYFSDGSYLMQNHTVVVKSEEDCKRAAPTFIWLDFKNLPKDRRDLVSQTGWSCTDAKPVSKGYSLWENDV